MPRDPKDISATAGQRTQRRIGELDDAKDPIRLRVGAGPAGAEGKEGKEGKEGAAGRSNGLRYVFLTDTENTNPTSGRLKLNNATPASVTALRISETDADGNSLSAYINAWDDSTSTVRGQIIIRSIATKTDLLIYNVTGALTDNGTWDSLVVTNVVAVGTFSNLEEVTVEFIRTGDEGKEGPAGAASMNGYKEPCRVATTSNVTISTALNPGDTIDGVVLAENDRVLVKDQTSKKENGIWVVKAVPARSTDADAAGELRGGTTVYVEQGTINGDRIWWITTNGSITPGTTEHEWAAEPRKVYGAVSSTGTKVNGSAGWTVSKPSTGRYNIELSPAATINPPNVKVITGPSTAAITVWTLREASTTLVQIQIWNFGSGTAVDYPFTFEITLD